MDFGDTRDGIQVLALLLTHPTTLQMFLTSLRLLQKMWKQYLSCRVFVKTNETIYGQPLVHLTAIKQGLAPECSC